MQLLAGTDAGTGGGVRVRVRGGDSALWPHRTGVVRGQGAGTHTHTHRNTHRNVHANVAPTL